MSAAWRLVQKGTGAVACGFLSSPALDAKLRAALPGRAIVATIEDGRSATIDDVARAARIGGLEPGAPCALFGYSAGCQGVRKLLRDGLDPTAVAPFDGSHSTMPVRSADVELWKRRADKARRGVSLFLATCSQQTYVERIPEGQPGRAASTRRVLGQAIGVDLAVASSRPPSGLRNGKVTGLPAAGLVGREVHDGALHVLSYATADVDHAEHAYQGAVVLPELLARYVGPWLSQFAPAVEEPVDLDLAAFRPGLRELAFLGGEFGLGPKEIPGARHNQRIVDYGESCRRGGIFLGVDGDGQAIWEGGARVSGSTDEEAWCAKLQSAALVATWRLGDPIHYYPRISVREWWEDAVRLGTARPPEYDPRPGDKAILGRDGEDPTKGGKGHIRAVVQRLPGLDYLGIGGNERNTILCDVHSTRDPGVRGWIVSA